MQYSLDRAIHDAKFGNESVTTTLSESQRDEILRIIGKRCRVKTVERLSRRLMLPLSLWNRYGIYSRLILKDERTSEPYYICGQSWNDEMRTLRECILKN